MGRRVAIVGVGLTKCSSHRKDVTYPELIYEAVSGALAQAGVTPKDVGAVVFGSMDPFDGGFAPGRLRGPGRLLPCRLGHVRCRVDGGLAARGRIGRGPTGA